MLLMDQSVSSRTVQPFDRNSECCTAETLTLYPSPEAEKVLKTEILSDLALFISGPYVDVKIQSSVDSNSSNDDDDDDSYGPELPCAITVKKNGHDSVLSFFQWEFDGHESFANEDGPASQNNPVENLARVRFMVDPNNADAVMCQIFENPIILSSKEISRRWYRSSDIKKFRHMSHREAFGARTSSTYVKQFRFLHASCDNSTSLLSLSRVFASTVASSPYRGYESLVFSDLYRTVRKAIVHEILQAQRDFRSTCHPSPEVLENLLSSRSKQLSKQSRRVAYVIGKGDADVARKIFTSKELEFITTLLREPTKVEL
jgi:hypothetical protein